MDLTAIRSGLGRERPDPGFDLQPLRLTDDTTGSGHPACRRPCRPRPSEPSTHRCTLTRKSTPVPILHCGLTAPTAARRRHRGPQRAPTPRPPRLSFRGHAAPPTAARRRPAEHVLSSGGRDKNGRQHPGPDPHPGRRPNAEPRRCRTARTSTSGPPPSATPTAEPHAPTARPPSQPDPERLQAAVDRVVARIDPDQVIIFGSAVRGDLTVESDIDLLVIAETETDGDRTRHEKWEAATPATSARSKSAPDCSAPAARRKRSPGRDAYTPSPTSRPRPQPATLPPCSADDANVWPGTPQAWG